METLKKLLGSGCDYLYRRCMHCACLCSVLIETQIGLSYQTQTLQDRISHVMTGRVPPGHTQKINTKSPSVNGHLLSLHQTLECNRSGIWDSIQQLKHYIKLGRQAMRRSASISMLSQGWLWSDYQNLVFGPLSFFRGSTMKMIKYEEDDDHEFSFHCCRIYLWWLFE